MSLGKLPDELLVFALEELYILSPQSLKSFSGVCHRFYRLAFPVLYRHVDETAGVADAANLMLQDIEAYRRKVGKFGPVAAEVVQSATLEDRSSSGTDETLRLVPFLSRASNLRRVTLFGNFFISKTILRTIDLYLPRVELYLNVNFPVQVTVPAMVLSELVSGLAPVDVPDFISPQTQSYSILRTHSTEYELRSGEHFELMRRSLETIIKTSPNLKVLRSEKTSWIDVFRGWGPDIDQSPQLDLHLSDSEDVTLPSLEQLRNVPLSMETLQLWTRLGSWDHLKQLEDHRPGCLRTLSGHVPALTHLTYNGCDIETYTLDRERFEAPMLTSITLISHNVPFNFLSHYAYQLEELILLPITISRPSGFAGGDRLRWPTLRRLNETCPNIKRLFIYFPNDNESRVLYIRELLEFKCLEQVILRHSTSPLSPKDTEKKTFNMSRSLCREIFGIFREQKAGCNLTYLGFTEQVAPTRFEDVQTLAEFDCRETKDGGTVYGVKVRNSIDPTLEKWVQEKSKAEFWTRQDPDRPFSAAYPQASLPEDLIWLALRLNNPGPIRPPLPLAQPQPPPAPPFPQTIVYPAPMPPMPALPPLLPITAPPPHPPPALPLLEQLHPPPWRIEDYVPANLIDANRRRKRNPPRGLGITPEITAIPRLPPAEQEVYRSMVRRELEWWRGHWGRKENWERDGGGVLFDALYRS